MSRRKVALLLPFVAVYIPTLALCQESIVNKNAFEDELAETGEVKSVSILPNSTEDTEIAPRKGAFIKKRKPGKSGGKIGKGGSKLNPSKNKPNRNKSDENKSNKNKSEENKPNKNKPREVKPEKEKVVKPGKNSHGKKESGKNNAEGNKADNNKPDESDHDTFEGPKSKKNKVQNIISEAGRILLESSRNVFEPVVSRIIEDKINPQGPMLAENAEQPETVQQETKQLQVEQPENEQPETETAGTEQHESEQEAIETK